MKNLIIILIMLGAYHSMASKMLSTSAAVNIIDNSIATALDSIFPEKCLGIWEGTMYIYSQGVLRDSVNVRFTAAKTDSIGTYIWKTEYLSATRPMVKDYKLVVDDLSTGRYLLDEGGGVKLVEYCIKDKMYSLFKVEDIYLTSCTELVGDNLIFEVTSGKELNEKEGIKNYSFNTVQRVTLHKID